MRRFCLIGPGTEALPDEAWLVLGKFCSMGPGTGLCQMRPGWRW